jgi:hypothetical protein
METFHKGTIEKLKCSLALLRRVNKPYITNGSCAYTTKFGLLVVVV